MARRATTLRIGLLALIWGSAFLWIKLADRGLSPAEVTLTRLVLGSAVLFAVVAAQRSPVPRSPLLWAHIVIAALFANAAPYLLFAVGEQHVASSTAGMLNATTPLWTVVIALGTRHQRSVTPWQAAGLLVGFGGAVLIFSPWQARSGLASIGAIEFLAAAASYGISYVYMDRYLARRGISAVTLSACQLLAASAWLAIALGIAGAPSPRFSAAAVASVAILGLIGTGAAYVLNYQIITSEGATIASTVTYLLPMVAIILGITALGEHVTGLVLAGIALILVGVALTRQRQEQLRSRAGESPGTGSASGRAAVRLRYRRRMGSTPPGVDAGVRQRLAVRFGSEVDAWLGELPGMLAALAERWQLELGPPIPRGSVSAVFRCRMADGRRAVLKASPDRARLAFEAAALGAWHSVHTPAVIALDEQLGALLIEAIEPGTPLAVSSAYPAAESIAELLSSLHGSGVPDPSYPAVSQRVASLFASSAKLYERHPEAAALVPPELYERGHRRAARLALHDSPAVLLHGDLTPGNILDGGAGRGLVAIDPAPCLGDAAFDAVDMILWQAQDLKTIETRTARLAAAAGVDTERLRDWCVAFAAMSALELASQGSGRTPRVEALLGLASRA